ncbi:MAG: phosphotransferase [Chitinophagaceae bacterium]|nr:phosphotransferase [Chitinophagaceae bacterium]
MSDFSVIVSTISPADIARFVRKTYPVTQNTTCRLLKTGINHTYRIDTEKESYIFRIYCHNWRSREEISEEIDLLRHLSQKNIPVSYPVADNSGRYIQEIQAPEGLRFAVLFSFAPGQKILTYSKEIHFEVGKLMARVHGVTKGLEQKRVTYTVDVLLNQSFEYFRPFLPENTEEMQFLMKTRPLLEEELLNADLHGLRNGIVHLDIWFDNLNISGHTITLFDFDLCGNGWLCLDVAYYVLQLYNTEKDASERAGKIQAFYSGYEAIEKISDEERRLMPVAGMSLYYFYMGLLCRRFNDWSGTFLNEVYLKRYVNTLIRPYYEATKMLF